MSRTLFVNRIRTTAGAPPPDGTIQNPFRTIQSAVNAAAARKPSAANPITIAILQGTYAENVVIDIDGVVLRGLGGVGSVRIIPKSGPAVTITNATPASVQSFAVSKDPAVLQSNGKAASPVKAELVDLYLESADGASPTVCVVGHPSRPAIGAAPHAIVLSNCLVHHADPQNGKALLAYFAEFIRARHNCELSAPTEIFNCLGFLVDDSDVQGFVLDFDPSAAPAPAGFELGLVANNASFLGPAAEIRGITPNEKVQPTLNTSFFDLILREAATFKMIGGCANQVEADGGATWKADGVHVLGNLTFAPGQAKVEMNGGRYMGALTDPAQRLVRNLGN